MTSELDVSICPGEVLEAIPWYPSGLGDAQRGAVEAHAADCAECRRELLLVQGEPIETLPEAPDAERVWLRVLERVAAEGDATPVRPSPPAPPRTAARRWWRAAARPLPLAASVALAIGFGVLGGAAGWLIPSADEPVYVPATAGDARILQAGPALDVVFRKNARAGEIEEAIEAVGGSVVAGPSGLGVYRIALPPGTDAHGAALALRAEADGVASLAEPVHP